MLRRLKSFFFYGLLDLAIIQLCTACETLLSEVTRKHLISRSVSHISIKKRFKEVSFSQLINFFLPVTSNLRSLPNSQKIIDNINWARSLRNELVHYGTSAKAMKSEKVKEAIQSVEDLTNFLITKRP